MNPPDPPDPPGRDISAGSKLKAWFRDLSGPKQVATTIVAVALGVSAVGGAIGVMYQGVAWFVPSIKPLPPPQQTKAKLTGLEHVPDVTLGEYVQWEGIPATEAQLKEVESELSKPLHQRLGNVIRFSSELKGFAGEAIYFRWTVLDADTKKPVNSSLANERLWPMKALRPQLNNTKGVLETWVPYPPNGSGAYLVEIAAYRKIEGQETPVKLLSATEKVGPPAEQRTTDYGGGGPAAEPDKGDGEGQPPKSENGGGGRAQPAEEETSARAANPTADLATATGYQYGGTEVTPGAIDGGASSP